MSGMFRTLYCALVLSLASSMTFAQIWKPVSGGTSPGYGNDVRSFSSSPESESTWWIATDGGGLFKTSDKGANWVAKNSGITNLRTISMWVDTSGLPNSTTSAYKVIVATTGGGVFISTDSGANFAASNSGLACTYVRTVRVISKSTALPNGRLLAGTDCGKSSGVYYSDDVGATWKASSGFPTDNFTVISTALISPTDSSGAAVATPYLLAATSIGLYKSTDSGLTWAALPSPSGPNGSVVYGVTWSYVAGATPAMRLLATVEGGGVFRSDNDGQTWAPSNTGLPTDRVPVPLSSVSHDGTYSNTFYVSLDGVGVYKSTDRAATWSLMKADADLPAVRQIAHRYSAGSTTATAAQKNILWAATLAGPYVSTDGGATWAAKGAGLPGGQIANTGFDSNNVAYAAAPDGVYKSTTADYQSWQKLPGLPKLNHLIVRGTDVWAATNSYGIFKYQAGTTPTWVATNQGLPSNLVYKNAILRIDPLNTSGMYVGMWGQGVYYFDGTSWTPRNNGLVGDALKIRFMSTMADRILLSTQAGLYLSTNQGQSWTQVGPKDSSGNWIRPGHTAIDFINPTTFYLAVYNTDPVAVSYPGNGLWKSTDSGATWTAITAFNGRRMEDVRVIRTSAGNMVAAASWDDPATTTNGLYFSLDGGSSWSAPVALNLVAAVNSVLDAPPLVSSRAGLYKWDTTLGLNERRNFMTSVSNNAVHYYYVYNLSASTGTVTGLSISANGQTAQGTSTVDSAKGMTYWQAVIDLGTSAPASTVSYVANIQTSSGAKTDTVSGADAKWLTSQPTGLLPNSNSAVATGSTVNFSWNPPTDAGVTTTYQVAIFNTSTKAILSQVNVGAGQAPSIALSAASLTANTSYGAMVTAVNLDPLKNLTSSSSLAGTFCYGCSNSALQPQTVTLNAPSVMVQGTSGQVSGTASSSLPVVISSTTPQVCSVSSSNNVYTATFTAPGSCVLVGVQAGSASFQSASATQTVLVTSTPDNGGGTAGGGGVNWAPVVAGNTLGYGGVVRSSGTSVDGKFWIATEGGGLYASSDGGGNWMPMNNGIVDLRLWGLAISQPASATSPYKVWVGSYGGGVYFSADSGQSFTAKNSGLNCVYVRNVRLLGTRLLASTDCAANSGVYYSDDDGNSWTLSTGDIPASAKVNSISYINPTGATAYLLANTSVGVFKSTNNAGSFTALTTSPGEPATTDMPERKNTYSISWISSGSTVTLLATVEGLGVYRSSDAGATWTKSNAGLPTSAALVPMSGMTSNGSGTFYLALDRFGVFKSTDQGTTWSQMSADAVLPSARYIQVINGTLYAATQAGPYMSPDGGLTWMKGGAGLPGGMLDNVIFTTSGDVYAGAADGVYKLDASTQNWIKIPGLPSTRSSNIIAWGNDVYAATDSYGVYKLISGQWTPMNSGLPANLVYNTPSLRADTDVTGGLYVGLYGGGVYYFDPAAGKWVARNTGLSGAALKIRYMATRGSTVLITTEGGLYISQDKGLTWAQSGPKLSDNSSLRPDRVAISRLDINTYYASVYNTDSKGVSSAGNGLWYSTNKGQVWSQVQALKDLRIHDVRSIYTGDAYLLTAASWDTDAAKGGLWVSQDNGTTWQQANNGLGRYFINGVFVNGSGPAYVTTRGGGMFVFNGGSGNGGGNPAAPADWRYFSTFTIDGSATKYTVNYGVQDNSSQVASITLTNGTLSTTSTTRNNNTLSASLDLGTTAPAASTTYTAVQAFNNGATPKATTFTVRSSGWATKPPTNISVVPSTCGTPATCPMLITWAPPAATDADNFNINYNVTVNTHGNTPTPMWSVNLGVGSMNSVAYTGTPLTSGVTYDIIVTAQSQDVMANTGYGASAAITYTPGATDARTAQTVNFTPVTIKTAGATATLAATATSNGAVYFSTDTPVNCSISGSTLTLTASGICVVKAVQPGNSTYKPATATQTIAVDMGGTTSGGTQAQTINFTAIGALSVGGKATLVATASSGGTVMFTSQTPSVCTVASDSTLTAVNAGACAVVASQVGSSTYAPASSAQYIVVNAATGTTTTTVGSVTTTTAGLSPKVSLASGWNLLGNGFNFGIDVATIFGDTSQFVTVWKWVASSSSWAFYAPSMTSDALATYAASKGYQVLTTINPGEGFWVNAKQASATPLDMRSDPSVDPSPFQASNFALGGGNQLSSGWGLIAIGERKSPKEFNQAYNLFAAPPSVGGAVVAENVTTIWAWDNQNSGWYFYAPSLENKGTLSNYITQKQYKDFGANKLQPTTGFWVNMP